MTRHQHERFLIKRCDVLFVVYVLAGCISFAIGIAVVWQFSRLESVTLSSQVLLTAKLSALFIVGLTSFKQALKVHLAARDRGRADERVEALIRQVDSIADSSKRDFTRAQLIIILAQRSHLAVSSDNGRESKRLIAGRVEKVGKSLFE